MCSLDINKSVLMRYHKINMSIGAIMVQTSLRFILYFTKLPIPDHYSIISLSPQYNYTKNYEVVYQKSIGVTNTPIYAVCQVYFLFTCSLISFFGHLISFPTLKYHPPSFCLLFLLSCRLLQVIWYRIKF